MSQQTERVTADATVAAGPASSSSTSASPAPAHPAPVAANPTLTVGHADDPMERLADAMADRAVAHLDASEPHRHTPGCGHLRRSVAPGTAPATVGLEGGALDGDASGQIEAARGGGRALPTDVRRRMEGAFGTSLSHVRVHDGAQAAKLSASMQASAFTTGSDVFFGAGQFAPGTPDGEHVLAHELAHVVTEGTGGVRRMVIRRGLLDKVKSLKTKLRGSKESREKAKAVANSKKVEKNEIKHHMEERARGHEQRSKTYKDVYGGGPAPSAPENETEQERKDRLKAEFDSQGEKWGKVQEITERFNQALQLEREEFVALTAQYKKDGVDKSEEDVAKEAYDNVWLNYVSEELRALRPPRETAAERLVMQVRQVQTGANVQQGARENLEEGIAKGGMLSKTVEGAYEVMVIHARRKQRAAQRKGQDLSDADARKEVRPLGVKHCEDEAKVRKHKVPRELPAEGSQLDIAAFEQAAQRVDLRGQMKEQQRQDIERLQSQLGGGEKAEDHENDTKDFTGAKHVDTVTSVVGGIGKAATKGSKQVSGAPKKFDKVKELFTNVKTERPKRDDYGTPVDMFDQVTSGIAASGSMLTQVASAVSEALTMARQIKAAFTSGDPWEAVKATKSGLGALDGLVQGASQAATLAKSVNTSLSKNVAGVTPGLGVATAAMSTAKALLDVAMAGRRQHETNTALFDARSRTKDKEADVLVWPLMKMSQAHTKTLENNVWGLGKSVFDMIVAIGELGSAGGAGVPKALQLGGKIVDSLHKLGHFVADELLVWMAKRAKKLSSVLHLEGAAQTELRSHPKMAVDAIIVRAVQGDQHAMTYVCNYYVDGKPVTPELVKRIDKVKLTAAQPESTGDKITEDTGAPENLRGGDDVVLLKIREAMLQDMNMDGDPKSTFDKIRAGATQAKGLGGLRKKWEQTGKMAELRNSHSGDEGFGHTQRSDRGIGWRLKMMLKGEEKFGRSKAKTQILKDMDDQKAAEARAAKVQSGDLLPEGITCAVGDKMLAVGPSVAEAEKFFDGLSLEELQAELKAEEGRTPPRNSPGWLEFMAEQIKKKEAAKSSSGTQGGGSGTGTGSKRSNTSPTIGSSRQKSTQQVGS